jgi:membrane-associated phospholipid phosphatase
LGNRNRVTRIFLLGLTAYSIIGLALFLLHGREGAHMVVNRWHHPWGDVFFRYFTETANGAVPVLVIHLLLFVRYSWALGLGVSAGVMGIVVQWLKRGVFDLPRPSAVFDQGLLHWVEGVEYASKFSFPSGHSATAFCMFFLFALMADRRWATWCFLVWAILAAFSRVYVSQHFIEDTVAGAWIGLGISWLAWRFIIVPIEKNPGSRLNGRLWPS